MNGGLAFTKPLGELSLRLVCDVDVASGLNEANVRTVKALWDAGAVQTCITKTLAVELNLLETGQVKIMSATGTKRVPKYFILLGFECGIKYNVDAFEIRKIADCDVVIGMDIISQGDFAVSNYGGKTQFTFRTPSAGHIDFRK